MNAILIDPGKDPAIISAPDTLQGIETYLQGHAEVRAFPFTPAGIFFCPGHNGAANKQWDGQWICGPILCYGWQRNTIKPLKKTQIPELVNLFKDHTELTMRCPNDRPE